ncbi:MAG: histidine phosphatase family protein, partial [Gemmatimonadaceae bacterium]
AGDAFGLTAAGREQVLTAVLEARVAGRLAPGCRVISSPLLRARESAAIAADVLGTTVHVDQRLIERGFGELELSTDDRYESVWSADRDDPRHERWGVESVTAILVRVSSLLAELQAAEPGATFVLCTHGDVASILLCAAQGEPLGRHRDIGAMGNAEVRALPADLSGLSRLEVG